MPRAMTATFALRAIPSALGAIPSLFLALALFSTVPLVPVQARQEVDEELEELLAEFRDEVRLLVRRGEWDEARDELLDLLSEDSKDWRTTAHLAYVEQVSGRPEAARGYLERTYPAARAGDPDLLLAFGADLELRVEYADTDGLDDLLEAIEQAGFDLVALPRLGWPAAQLLLERGERSRAAELLARLSAFEGDDWRDCLAAARAARWLGRLERASVLVVKALEPPFDDEAEALAELASIYFEAEGEGQGRASRDTAPGPLFREALDRNPRSESALLGLHALGKINWRRQRTAASEYVRELLTVRPASVAGQLALARDELALGRLPEVRAALESLERSAPTRRSVRTLRATLAWVEHDRDGARAILDELVDQDPADSTPEREVGASLLELYRFSEALDFLERAVERNEQDYLAWTRLGEALANTGSVERGLEALQRARELAKGRHDVWRKNTRVVLERITSRFEELDAGGLQFAWSPAGSEVLATYLVPFYQDARRELALRYGYSSGPVRIEVFDRHEDFSVRSTGFQGFPALGVCFGPVVTAVSPLSELRGTFSWARTSYHEFTHVVHLGISNNRCPRWITEGLATWEEERVNPSWGRNMRRDLLDARANGQVFPLRELNAAFRGPRIVFGYYQGGLLCEMLIDAYGFPSMIRLLEAFDSGLDLDRACAEVFDATPEEIDARFASFVDAELSGLRLEPRFDAARALALRYTLAPDPPTRAAELEAWREAWLDVAFAFQQQGRRVDAEDALRRARAGGVTPVRAHALLGRMAFADGDAAGAVEHWLAFLEAGGEDFFVRMALADHAFNELEDQALAEEHLLAAEAAFPGFADLQASAELALASYYDRIGDEDRAMDARMRWLDFNADAGELRIEVARWLAERDRHEEAARYFREANEVDPFRASLHMAWGASLEALGQLEDALREYRVTTLVPAEFDAEGPTALSDDVRADSLVSAARVLEELGRRAEALESAREALEVDGDLRQARDLVERLEAR